MKYSLSLVLDLRYKNKDSNYQICLRLYFKNTKYYIPLNVWINKDHWDDDNERILPAAKMDPSTTWYNDRIFDRKKNAKYILSKLDESHSLDDITAIELKKRIQNKYERVLFYDFIDSLINNYREHNKDGTANAYRNAKSFLEHYLPGKKNLYFDDITYKLLKSIEFKYIAKGHTYNGLSVYLRTIRSTYNKAIMEWPELAAKYPFRDYKIKQIKTHKKAIGRADLTKLMNLSIDKDNRSWDGRNMFFFSFYCRGINLADIAKLKGSNIQNGNIVYRRSKNSKPFTIRINDNISAILNEYLSDKKPDDFIFPILSKTSNDNIPDQVTDFRNMINHALKRWAKKLNIDPSLSFNTARHCWATIGKELNLSISEISEGLGYEDIRTTQIYLDSFKNEVIDDANDLIGNSINQ